MYQVPSITLMPPFGRFSLSHAAETCGADNQGGSSLDVALLLQLLKLWAVALAGQEADGGRTRDGVMLLLLLLLLLLLAAVAATVT